MTLVAAIFTLIIFVSLMVAAATDKMDVRDAPMVVTYTAIAIFFFIGVGHWIA